MGQAQKVNERLPPPKGGGGLSLTQGGLHYDYADIAAASIPSGSRWHYRLIPPKQAR